MRTVDVINETVPTVPSDAVLTGLDMQMYLYLINVRVTIQRTFSAVIDCAQQACSAELMNMTYNLPVEYADSQLES